MTISIEGPNFTQYPYSIVPPRPYRSVFWDLSLFHIATGSFRIAVQYGKCSTVTRFITVRYDMVCYEHGVKFESSNVK